MKISRNSITDAANKFINNHTSTIYEETINYKDSTVTFKATNEPSYISEFKKWANPSSTLEEALKLIRTLILLMNI